MDGDFLFRGSVPTSIDPQSLSAVIVRGRSMGFGGRNYVSEIQVFRPSMECLLCFGKLPPEACSQHGQCRSLDVCECAHGYSGVECDRRAICHDIIASSPEVCGGHGSCVTDNWCDCMSPKDYGGSNCSDPVCPDSCGHGTCVSPHECACENAYGGPSCRLPRCGGTLSNESEVCSGNGKCVAPEACECVAGYVGDACESIVCFDRNTSDPETSVVCSYPNGTCSSPNYCDCLAGHVGEECEILLCYGRVASDPDSGACHHPNGTCVAPDECVCSSGFEGQSCQTPICFDLTKQAACSFPNGSCVGRDNCAYVIGHSGAKCEDVLCFGEANPDACNGDHGECIAPDRCSCVSPASYAGPDCRQPLCFGIAANNASACLRRGKCVSPGVCACDDSYTGEQCSVPVCFGKNVLGGNPPCSHPHGHCTAGNTCKCQDNYWGAECQFFGIAVIPSCFDLQANDSRACSQHGRCVSTDVCLCDRGFAGESCTDLLEVVAAGASSKDSTDAVATVVPIAAVGAVLLVAIFVIVGLLVFMGRKACCARATSLSDSKDILLVDSPSEPIAALVDEVTPRSSDADRLAVAESLCRVLPFSQDPVAALKSLQDFLFLHPESRVLRELGPQVMARAGFLLSTENGYGEVRRVTSRLLRKSYVVYEGEICDGFAMGTGKQKTRSGVVSHYGRFMFGLRHGQGVEFTADGEKVLRRGEWDKGDFAKDYDTFVLPTFDLAHLKPVLGRLWTSRAENDDGMKFLGSGGFADVFKIRVEGMFWAFKMIRNSGSGGRRAALLEEMRKEVLLLSRLKHEHVMEVAGICTNPVGVVTELLSVTLSDYLREQTEPLGFGVVMKLLLEVAEGAEYLHLNHVLHRDLKWDNVMALGSLEAELSDWTVKLIDFNLAKVNMSFRQALSRADSACGTMGYQAPEVRTQKYSYPADVFSYGVMIYELLSGDFRVKTSIPQVEKIREDVGREYRRLVDLAEMCLDGEQHKRPTFSQVVRLLHSFVSTGVSKTPPSLDGGRQDGSETRSRLEVLLSETNVVSERSKRLVLAAMDEVAYLEVVEDGSEEKEGEVVEWDEGEEEEEGEVEFEEVIEWRR